MSQQTRLSKGNTTVKTVKGKTVITFYSTDIVKFDSKSITLNSGGYQTATTKTRINQASNQFDLGYTIYQRNGEWFVDTATRKEIHFRNGLKIDR